MCLKRSLAPWWMLAAAGLLVGCTGTQSLQTANKKEIPTDPPKVAGQFGVKVGGMGTTLSDGQVASTKWEDILPPVKQMLRERRLASVGRFIETRPDMAIEALRSHVGDGGDSETYAAIAWHYDRTLGLPRESGWSSLYSGKVGGDALRAYGTARARILGSAKAGGKEKTSIIELAKATRHPQVFFDAHYLQGVEHLIENRPDQAVKIWNDALRIRPAIDSYQVAQLKLLISDAQRRTGDHETADATWEEAVQRAAELAVANPPVVDPIFWDRASYLRPVSKSWPQPCAAALVSHSPIPVNSTDLVGDDRRAEAVVWGAIGQALLNRGESQSALIALKRAEAASDWESARAWLRRGQAQALAALDQTPAASAILVVLSSSKDAVLGRAAAADLGALKLRQGDSATGTRLLSKALESETLLDWPRRDRSEADLGLAYLIRGEEAKGLEWLHSAQNRFRRSGDAIALHQALWNEQAYYKQMKKPKQEASVASAILTLESERR